MTLAEINDELGAARTNKKEFLEKHISQQLEDIIAKRNTVIAKRQEKGFVPILEVDNENIYFILALLTISLFSSQLSF